MKLDNEDKALLFRIIKPYVASEDWNKKEISQLETFLKRLIYSMNRTGFDMLPEIKFYRDQNKRGPKSLKNE